MKNESWIIFNYGNVETDLRDKGWAAEDNDLYTQDILQVGSLINFREQKNLKGVFAKNERGYRLKAKNKRFWSLLILLLSVARL